MSEKGSQEGPVLTVAAIESTVAEAERAARCRSCGNPSALLVSPGYEAEEWICPECFEGVLSAARKGKWSLEFHFSYPNLMGT